MYCVEDCLMTVLFRGLCLMNVCLEDGLMNVLFRGWFDECIV